VKNEGSERERGEKGKTNRMYFNLARSRPRRWSFGKLSLLRVRSAD